MHIAMWKRREAKRLRRKRRKNNPSQRRRAYVRKIFRMGNNYTAGRLLQDYWKRRAARREADWGIKLGKQTQ